MLNDKLLNAQNNINRMLKDRYYQYDRTYFNKVVNDRNRLVKECQKTKKNVTYLKPIYDRQKSFYKKAYFIENNEMIQLFSYDTLVLTYFKSDDSYLLNDLVNDELLFSNTTKKHLLEFLNQKNYNFKIIGKSIKDTLKKNQRLVQEI